MILLDNTIFARLHVCTRHNHLRSGVLTSALLNHTHLHCEPRATDPNRCSRGRRLVFGAAGRSIHRMVVFVVRHDKFEWSSLKQRCVYETRRQQYYEDALASRSGSSGGGSQLCVANTNELLICASNLYAGSPFHNLLCSDEMLCLTHAAALKVSGSAGL